MNRLRLIVAMLLVAVPVAAGAQSVPATPAPVEMGNPAPGEEQAAPTSIPSARHRRSLKMQRR